MLDKSESVHRHSVFYLFIKRIFDIVASSIGIIFLIPITLIVGLAIKIEDGGPIFFCQERVTKNGKLFKLIKFRSMVINAEALRDSLEKDNEMDGPVFKIKNDKRITKVGHFIRKTSIDELPQLLNILKGDLSVVGPRPVIGDELEKYGLDKEKFLSVKPGLTGYWACHGRSNTTYDERMKMELFYVDNRSFSMDIKIIFETAISVLKKDGAV